MEEYIKKSIEEYMPYIKQIKDYIDANKNLFKDIPTAFDDICSVADVIIMLNTNNSKNPLHVIAASIILFGSGSVKNGQASINLYNSMIKNNPNGTQEEIENNASPIIAQYLEFINVKREEMTRNMKKINKQ